MSIVERRFSKLYVALGHGFVRPEVLEEALTHPSATAGEGQGKRNYERLEFLGDRVLGLAISQVLMQRFPGEKVGALARRHTALVRAEALTRIAQQIELGQFINMSKGEEDAGGRDNPQILADCCEAVIAALFIDGGIEAANRFINQHWVPMMNEAIKPPKDAKTALQEWAQSQGLPLPNYTTVEQAGPAHEPVFRVQASVRGFPRATATGKSKRAAEQSAAALLIRLIRSHKMAVEKAEKTARQPAPDSAGAQNAAAEPAKKTKKKKS